MRPEEAAQELERLGEELKAAVDSEDEGRINALVTNEFRLRWNELADIARKVSVLVPKYEIDEKGRLRRRVFRPDTYELADGMTYVGSSWTYEWQIIDDRKGSRDAEAERDEAEEVYRPARRSAVEPERGE